MLQLDGSWLHVSAALRPSSGQLAQIKCPQGAYNMGSHSVYNQDICGIILIFKCDLNQRCYIFYFPEYVSNSVTLPHIRHDCTHYGIQYCTHIEGTLSVQVGLKMAAMRPKHVPKYH